MRKLPSFNFKPSKNILFTTRNKSNFDSIPLRKTHSFSNHQKAFNTITPVRPFNRFIKPKIYGTGSDPSSAFLHFIKKDCEKPYKKKISPIITEGIKYIPHKNIKWSLGTTCQCNNKDYLPKFDPFKEYHFSSENDKKEKGDRYLRNEIQKNHDAFKTIDVGSDNNSSFLNMKKKFNFNTESNSFWSPYSCTHDNNFNRSSVNYNIISNKENKISGKIEISAIEKTVNNKKKGVTEFYHLQRNYEPNYSPKFSKFIHENNNGFMKYKGVFTELYDSYIKNGNIYKPFLIDSNNFKFAQKKKQFNNHIII